MDDIDSAVKNAYFTLYSYMVMRKGFWKDGLYRGKTIENLAMEAYDSWKKAQYIAKQKNSMCRLAAVSLRNERPLEAVHFSVASG